MDAIDRFFDVVDRGVDHVDRVLNRGKQTVSQHRARRARRPEVIEADAAQKPSEREAPSTSAASVGVTTTALARKPRFYIVEAIAKSGGTRFVVTDGGSARAECTSRELAERLLHALQAAP
jgi:hypothetical protein